jgi:uncharacterized membrane protein YgdD (TMEM256/DUF423 family)
MKSLSYLMIALGVCAGAFGAHGLKDLVTPERLEVFKTASNYQITMSIVLLFLAKDIEIKKGILFLLLAGIIIFSGSLYLLVLLNLPILGAITPIGGSCIILSLLLAAFTSWKKQAPK